MISLTSSYPQSKRSQFLKKLDRESEDVWCSSQIVVISEKLMRSPILKRFIIQLSKKLPMIIIKKDTQIKEQITKIQKKLLKQNIHASFILFGDKQMAEKSLDLSDLFIRTDRLENIDEKALLARILKFSRKEVD